MKNLINKNAKLSPFIWQEPMLATLTYDYFSDSEWIFECKMDGERCFAYFDGKNIILYSRNRQTLNTTYPEIVEAMALSKNKRFIIDGEIIALNKEGISSFSVLQNRLKLKEPSEEQIRACPVYYYVFDIIYYDKFDLKEIELIDRKNILKQCIKFNQTILFTEYYKEHGLKYFELAYKKKWEGIIAKNSHSTYQNCRSRDWLKFKCSYSQEFIILGYTKPKGARKNFGALLLGYYEKSKLCYAGKVGTGFDQSTLKYLKNLFKPFEHKNLNLNVEVKTHGVQWLEPKLICEIVFSEWTKNKKLRNPRYKGLRMDKNPESVIKEDWVL